MIDGWVANNSLTCQNCMYGNHHTQACSFAGMPWNQNPNRVVFEEWNQLRNQGGWRHAMANAYVPQARQGGQHAGQGGQANYNNQGGQGNFGCHGNFGGGEGGQENFAGGQGNFAGQGVQSGENGGYGPARRGFRGRSRGRGGNRGNYGGQGGQWSNGCQGGQNYASQARAISPVEVARAITAVSRAALPVETSMVSGSKEADLPSPRRTVPVRRKVHHCR
ncbi:heterogeneous nuclear ribonucleoproteins A1 homolog [Paramacrobiotus metropolitanus]|uniref:heterogeneous nuclear ribonucleoproteins A1 homolog n=1 Tax=Paramacrobiotus metropolitanus TaxID=2943436 RepID=UPI002445A4DE|nr:heterogeneous nuclear ribonucleoproteins A1 homolog [Paramacrobiotus metropolitanus]